MKIFLVSRDDEMHLVRSLMPQDIIITMMNSLDAMKSYLERHDIKVKRDANVPEHFGITPEGRERMRAAKLGDKNPNASGLSQEHRAAISRTKRRTNRGPEHPMFGRHHRATSRLKTSLSMKMLGKRRWVVDDEGREHLVMQDFELPAGWYPGRARYQGGRQ